MTAAAIAVTGAKGFLGAEVERQASGQALSLHPLNRPQLGDLGAGAIRPDVVVGCFAVIHAAARAHRMDEAGATALAAYRRTNVEGTRALIAAMVAAGVRRLVYVSSIKVVGEASRGEPLRPGDPPDPRDPYGISKAEAEHVVTEAHVVGQIEAVIVRPVLVHGSGAQGNLARLLRAIQAGRPLPFGRVRNRRSLVGVTNLAEALLVAATAPVLPGSQRHPAIYHLADEGVVSSRRLAELLAEGMGVRPRLWPVPRWAALTAAWPLGKAGTVGRLFGDLEVDAGDFTRDFAWRPRIGLEDGLRAMGRAWIERGGW